MKTCILLRAAAEHGQLPMVRWLGHPDRGPCKALDLPEACRAAAKNNYLQLVQYFVATWPGRAIPNGLYGIHGPCMVVLAKAGHGHYTPSGYCAEHQGRLEYTLAPAFTLIGLTRWANGLRTSSLASSKSGQQGLLSKQGGNELLAAWAALPPEILENIISQLLLGCSSPLGAPIIKCAALHEVEGKSPARD